MQEKQNGAITQIIRGTFISTIITLVLILAFALILKFALLSSGVIKTVNQFIKVLALFLGCFISVKESAGLIKGLLLGVAFALIVNLLFALFGGNAFLSVGLFVDMLFCGIIGAISGILSVNLSKNK